MNNSLLELKERYSEEYTTATTHPKLVISIVGPKNLQTNVAQFPLIKLQNILIKRLFDVLISSLTIVLLLSWLIPILAILIKIDSKGPVFFIQKRNKKDGKFFYCLKLRTMVVNAESDTLTAIFNDKRITSLGKFLRNSHLDELPQFFNVLIGDMSIIGPRPHMYIENMKYNARFDHYHERHAVKPGITGLAQSLGYHGPITNSSELEKKIAYDIFYIRHWTLLMDAKIFVSTVVTTYKKFVLPLKS